MGGKETAVPRVYLKSDRSLMLSLVPVVPLVAIKCYGSKSFDIGCDVFPSAIEAISALEFYRERLSSVGLFLLLCRPSS